jgi:ligand-binding sensor domain-containing protein
MNGMSKFDGKHFTTYRTNDGLNSNTITSLAEGDNGELYIGNYVKGINVLKNGRIENYCSEISGKSFATSYLLLANRGKEKQKLYAYRAWGAINVIGDRKPNGRADYSFSSSLLHITKMAEFPNGSLIVLTTSGLFNLKNDSLTKLDIAGLTGREVYCFAEGKDSSYLIGAQGAIFRIKNNKIIQKLIVNLAGNNQVISILNDKNNNLWFSVMNKGFFLIPDSSDQIIDVGGSMDLRNTLVNHIVEDDEGNIWISTFGKGVYCLNNLYLKSYSERDGLSNNNVYSIVKMKSGNLLIGTFNGLNILDNGKFVQVKGLSGKTLTENITGIESVKGDYVICGSFGGNEIITVPFKGIKLRLIQQPSFCRTNESLYLFGLWDNSIIVQKELNFKQIGFRLFLFGDSSNINRVNKIFQDSRGNIWIGTNFGLCKLSGLSDQSGKLEFKKTFFLNNPVLNAKINAIIEDAENNLWIAGETGIARLNLNNDSLKVYVKISGYDLSSSTSIVTDNKKRIWVGNMKGVFMIDRGRIELLNTQTGLLSDEVYALWYDPEKNELLMGTGNGISILDVNLFDSYIPLSPEVKVISLKAGEIVYNSFDKLVFGPEQHNIYLKFAANCFSSPGSVKYKYNLNGKWFETDHDFLDFTSLEKGKYQLQIMAKSQNSKWGKPFNLMFEITPLYYETIWFKLGRILFIVLISVFLVRWRWKLKSRKISKELELTERINELKHQALSAMMNPHFIFNSLNSVQFLINSHRNEEANDYIAMMAKLVRKNLDTAGNGFILLSEEIIRLRLYLDLEKLRFQEGFSYELLTMAGVEAGSVMIPNMIIQPFVENTLWHGIIDSGKKGMVTISFSFEGVDIDSVISRSLIIRITDNGIGLNKARKSKKEDHISKGIQIIEERLSLLSAKMELPKPVMLEDLSNRNNNIHGTEVIISLPLPLYKIIIPK